MATQEKIIITKGEDEDKTKASETVNSYAKNITSRH